MSAEESLVFEADFLSHKQYSFLLTLFYAQFLAGEISEEEYAMAVHDFTAADVYGDEWTFSPETGQWLRIGEGDWTVGEPRGPLLLALPTKLSVVLHAFTDEMEEFESAASESDALSLEEAGISKCPHCGVELPPGSRFCNICGREVWPQEHPPDMKEAILCPACGERISPRRFCTQCGARLE